MRSLITPIGAVAALILAAIAAPLDLTTDVTQANANVFFKAASDLNTEPNVSTKGWIIGQNVCAHFHNTGSLGLKGGWRTAHGWACAVFTTKDCTGAHIEVYSNEWSGNPAGMFSAQCFSGFAVKVAGTNDADDFAVVVADEDSTASTTYSTTFSKTITQTYTKDGQATTVTFCYVDDDPCRDCPDPTSVSATGDISTVGRTSISTSESFELSIPATQTTAHGVMQTLTIGAFTTAHFSVGDSFGPSSPIPGGPVVSGPVPSGPVSFGQPHTYGETHFTHPHASTLKTAASMAVSGPSGVSVIIASPTTFVPSPSYSVDDLATTSHFTGGEPQLSLPPAVLSSLQSLRSTAVPEPPETTMMGNVTASTDSRASLPPWLSITDGLVPTGARHSGFNISAALSLISHVFPSRTASSVILTKVSTNDSTLLITPAPTTMDNGPPLNTDSNGVPTGFPSWSNLGDDTADPSQPTQTPIKRQAQSYEYCRAQCEEDFTICMEQYGSSFRPACECKVYAPGTYCRSHCSGGHKPETYNAACSGDSQAKTTKGGIIYDGGAPPKRDIESPVRDAVSVIRHLKRDCNADCSASYSQCMDGKMPNGQKYINNHKVCTCQTWGRGSECGKTCAGPLVGAILSLYGCNGEQWSNGIIFDGNPPATKRDIMFLHTEPENGTVTAHDCFPDCLVSLAQCYYAHDHQECVDYLFGEGTVCTMSCPNAISVFVEWGHALNRALNLADKGTISTLGTPGQGFTQTLLSATGKEFVTVTTTGSVMPTLLARKKHPKALLKPIHTVTGLEDRSANVFGPDFTLCTGMVSECMTTKIGEGFSYQTAMAVCRKELADAGCPDDVIPSIDPSFTPPAPPKHVKHGGN